ncbi:MAG: trigger factor [Methylococcaceae bacterium]|nr:trigger factor [Methylococcaceae bacterium]
MQVSVEKTSELSRKMTVSLPEKMVQEKMDARFKSLAREVKIDGFRPGKVPVRVVKKMYSDRVRSEVTGDLIQTTYFQALQEQNINPAGQPHINPTDETSGFEYTAEFEVYPEVSLDGLSALEIKRPVATVEQADQDAMVTKLREQKKDWNDVERTAEKGDRVTIHFSGVCEGENFTEGKVESYQVVIGAGQMVPGFEDELIGLDAGANKAFEVTFPEGYGNEKLAAKPAAFEVELVKVEESFIPEIDEDFIKTYGVEDGSIESFNADVKANMERELTQGLKGKLKNAVMDALYENIQISVPNALIDQEIQNMMKPYEANARKQNMKLEDLDLPKELFEEQAKRRVALGLILGEIIKTNEIKVDDDKVRSTVEEMAVSYERPEDVIAWYYSDDSRLNEVKQMVLEDQTVGWIVDQAQVTDETVSFADVMEKQQQQ